MQNTVIIGSKKHTNATQELFWTYVLIRIMSRPYVDLCFLLDVNKNFLNFLRAVIKLLNFCQLGWFEKINLDF